MARIETLVDDLTQAEGAETHTFSIDGDEYEIDLVEANFTKLVAALAKYTKAGRKAGRSVRTTSPKSATKRGRKGKATPAETNKEHLAAIREWARGHGHEVSDRGRIPRDIVDAYEEAHAVSA